jgi:DNA-binding MarR family transcriptional regulator
VTTHAGHLAVPTSGRAAAKHTVSRHDLGFRLAKASQHWNKLLAEAFRAAGFAEVRPSYGSVLVPLFEEDGLRMAELALRARLAKQTMTTMVRLVERAGLVVRRPDPDDARATRVHLTERGRLLEPVAATAVAGLEQRVEARLGARRTASLRAALAQFTDV